MGSLLTPDFVGMLFHRRAPRHRRRGRLFAPEARAPCRYSALTPIRASALAGPRWPWPPHPRCFAALSLPPCHTAHPSSTRSLSLYLPPYLSPSPPLSPSLSLSFSRVVQPSARAHTHTDTHTHTHTHTLVHSRAREPPAGTGSPPCHFKLLHCTTSPTIAPTPPCRHRAKVLLLYVISVYIRCASRCMCWGGNSGSWHEWDKTGRRRRFGYFGRGELETTDLGSGWGCIPQCIPTFTVFRA
jgi:hypothetical protein